MALRKMRNEHHVYTGMAKSLQKWVSQEFEEGKLNTNFISAVAPNAKSKEEMEQEIDDLLSDLL